jgi:hypothetical protein
MMATTCPDCGARFVRCDVGQLHDVSDRSTRAVWKTPTAMVVIRERPTADAIHAVVEMMTLAEKFFREEEE